MQVVIKHMKRYLISLAIHKMQIKTTVRHHYSPIHVAKKYIVW